MKNYLVSFWVAWAVIILSGCADSRRGDVYSRDEARRPMTVQYGRVDSVRMVQIEGERGFIGQAGGGLIGGAAGNMVGSGAGRTLATAAGAVAGAVAGGATQERVTRKQGAEITVRLDGGGSVVIVQEVEHPDEFMARQRVRILRGNDGSARVAPLGGDFAPP